VRFTSISYGPHGRRWRELIDPNKNNFSALKPLSMNFIFRRDDRVCLRIMPQQIDDKDKHSVQWFAYEITRVDHVYSPTFTYLHELMARAENDDRSTQVADDCHEHKRRTQLSPVSVIAKIIQSILINVSTQMAVLKKDYYSRYTALVNNKLLSLRSNRGRSVPTR
jgi:hypothetical protein